MNEHVCTSVHESAYTCLFFAKGLLGMCFGGIHSLPLAPHVSVIPARLLGMLPTLSP